MEFDVDTNINITKGFAKASLSALTLPRKCSVTTLTQFQAFNLFSEKRHEKLSSLTNFLMFGPFNTAALIFSEDI